MSRMRFSRSDSRTNWRSSNARRTKRDGYRQSAITSQNGFQLDSLHLRYVSRSLLAVRVSFSAISLLQPLGGQVKPVENARYEAYQMRVQGRNYNTSADQAKGNANKALESMMRPEVQYMFYVFLYACRATCHSCTSNVPEFI